MFEKEIKILTKVYKKKLNKLHKKNLKNDYVDLSYFVTYLQLQRDKLALRVKDSKDLQFVKLVSLTATIDIYNQYENCLNKYFIIEEDEIKPKGEGTKEEALVAYSKERRALWTKLCDILKENAPLWEIENDKI